MKIAEIEGKRKVVINMLKEGMDVSLIVKLTELTEKEVVEIKKEIEHSI